MPHQDVVHRARPGLQTGHGELVLIDALPRPIGVPQGTGLSSQARLAAVEIESVGHIALTALGDGGDEQRQLRRARHGLPCGEHRADALVVVGMERHILRDIRLTGQRLADGGEREVLRGDDVPQPGVGIDGSRCVQWPNGNGPGPGGVDGGGRFTRGVGIAGGAGAGIARGVDIARGTGAGTVVSPVRAVGAGPQLHAPAHAQRLAVPTYATVHALIGAPGTHPGQRSHVKAAGGVMAEPEPADGGIVFAGEVLRNLQVAETNRGEVAGPVQGEGQVTRPHGGLRSGLGRSVTVVPSPRTTRIRHRHGLLFLLHAYAFVWCGSCVALSCYALRCTSVQKSSRRTAVSTGFSMFGQCAALGITA